MNTVDCLRHWILGGALALVCLPAGIVAQQPPGPGRLQLERQVWARFGEIVRERLGLTAEDQSELGEVLRTYQEDREALALREAQLQRRVLSESLLTAREVAPLLTDDEARAILSEMEAIRDEERRLAAAEQERLLELLTPSQLVRFYALRDALNQRTRGLRQGGPARPGGVGRGGGPLGLPLF